VSGLVEAREPAADGPLDVVTGAFSYSGSAIARRLLQSGRRVRTLTGHPARAPSTTTIDVRPLDFSDTAGLARSLEGATTLYNTYWVRFPRGRVTHDVAVERSAALFEAARAAGVERIVHISITNPSASSPYSYYRGKAAVEAALRAVGTPAAVLRPGILFGGDGVLINNIAWLLRRLPVFAVGGDGSYRIRPIHIDDLARLCVEAGAGRDDVVLDAVGQERPTFLELVREIKAAVSSSSVIVKMPAAAVPVLSAGLGFVLRDVLLTRQEYRAMADGLADTDGPSTGQVVLSNWIADNAAELGRQYAHEVKRHFR
jgi:NADH dehydrogenase